MDNYGIHSPEMMEENLSTLPVKHIATFLPPYSPQLNIIEKAFSKWKQYIKTNIKRNRVDLLRLIAEGAATITDVDCAGWYRDVMKWYVHCAAGRPLGEQRSEEIDPPNHNKRSKKTQKHGKDVVQGE